MAENTFPDNPSDPNYLSRLASSLQESNSPDVRGIGTAILGITQNLFATQTHLTQMDQANTSRQNDLSMQLSSLQTSVQDLAHLFQPQDHSNTATSSLQSPPIVAQPSSQPVATLPPLRDMPKFDGSSALECQTWVIKANDFFKQYPHYFQSFEQMKSYITQCASGDAFNLIRPASVATPPPDWYQSWEAFKQFVLEHFGASAEALNVPRQLQLVRHNKCGSVREYIREFSTYAAASGWNDRALRDLFRFNLTTQFSQELARSDASHSLTLHSMQQWAVNFQNALDASGQKSLAQRLSPPSLAQRISQPLSSSNSLASARPPPPVRDLHKLPPSDPDYLPPHIPLPSTEPMQLDAFGKRHISAEERMRRTNYGLCRYCSRYGHLEKTDPNCKANQKASQSAQLGSLDMQEPSVPLASTSSASPF